MTGSGNRCACFLKMMSEKYCIFWNRARLWAELANSLKLTVLDQARFTEANLTNTNLTGAYAFSAQFQGAIIDGADFTDAEMRPDTQKLLCEVAKGKNPITGHDTRASLACD
jgi:hypothetical protein